MNHILVKAEKFPKNINSDTIYIVKIPNSYGTLHIVQAGDNCKLIHIGNLFTSSLTFSNSIETLKIIEKRIDKLAFTVNVSKLEFIEALNKEFRLLNCQILPIGYDNTYTYIGVFLFDNNFNSFDIDTSKVIYRLKKEKEILDNFKYECIFQEKDEPLKIAEEKILN